LLEVGDSVNRFISGGNLVNFKPNQISIKPKDSVIKTSIRFNKNWYLNGNGRIVNQNGLLCIKDAKGEIELVYKNEQTKIGAVYSLISLILFLIFLRFTSFFEFKPQ